MKKKLWVGGMSCPKCLHHLERAFEELGGSLLATDLSEGTLTIDLPQALDDGALAEVVEEAGYDFVRAEDGEEGT
ncbi:MAG: heavy-metal-associated domain-containing protein [Myxococcales bacterium]|nr:heavy-metal-associated domain-containing protein [Myxococcales bacterium]